MRCSFDELNELVIDEVEYLLAHIFVRHVGHYEVLMTLQLAKQRIRSRQVINHTIHAERREA